MANTKKPTSSNTRTAVAELATASLEARVHASLTPRVAPSERVLLGLSGGLDSVTLLTLLATARRAIGFELHAMHVHHGLSPHAERWASFCQELCRSHDVPLQIVRVTLQRKSASSTEAMARKARYDALLSAPADHVALAHHRDDQAETLLLQLIRGAGVKGLSAMAGHDMRRRLIRPLLDVGRDEIRAYAEQQGLSWVEDESNQDTRYDRNHLRHHILPALASRFPGAGNAIARSASHIAEAAELLNDLAALDAQRCMRHGQLAVSELQTLSNARARNLLRWWIAGQDIALPSTARLQEMLHQLIHARQDAQVRMSLGSDGVCLRRYQDMAYLDQERPTSPFSLIWQGEPSLLLPDGSRLWFQHGVRGGLACQRLRIDRLRIAQRIGGERFKPDLARPSRTLKHLLQEASMPPWERLRLPLIYHEDRLAVVPGIGVAADMQAGADEPGLQIIWDQAAA